MTRNSGVPTAHRARVPQPRPKTERLPDHQPTAGHYLLAGIDSV